MLIMIGILIVCLIFMANCYRKKHWKAGGIMSLVSVCTLFITVYMGYLVTL